MTGGCLCSAVRFVVESFAGPFELCPYSRCRKTSGSAFVSGIGVRARDFRWVSGEEDVRFFEAPVRKHAAGLLDGDLGIAPDQQSSLIMLRAGMRLRMLARNAPSVT